MARPNPLMRIFQAGTGDVEELAALFDAYRCFYGQTPDPAGCRCYLEAEIAAARSPFFLARNESGIAMGFVHLLPSTNTLVMRPIWYLEDRYVDPAFRRRGVAKALMRAAEEFARQTGAERLTLATARDNTAAQALYRKLGFEREEHFWYFHRPL